MHYKSKKHSLRKVARAAEYSAVYKSSWFGEIPGPRNTLEFMRLLDDVPGFIGPLNRGLWRGQSHYSWRIEPSAVRRVINHHSLVRVGPDRRIADTTLAQEVIDYEKGLLLRARGSGVFAAGAESDLRLMALLQHHGAATRLLDFTSDPFIALWFACQGHTDECGLLFYVDAPDLSLSQEEEALMPDALLDSRNAGILFWRPAQIGGRMLAQRSVFAIGRVGDSVRGAYSDATGFGGHSRFPDMYRIPLAVVVTPELKADFNLKADRYFGLRHELLFPDIDGFARANSAERELVANVGQPVRATIRRHRRPD